MRISDWSSDVCSSDLAEVVETINDAHTNPLFLPGIALSRSIRATGDLGELDWADALLVVAPAQHVRTLLGSLPQGHRPLILCSTGIEAGSMKLLNGVDRKSTLLNSSR